MSILSAWADLSRESLVPMQVSLEMTYRCNERCSHCYLATYDDRADGRPPLTLEEWIRVLDQLQEAGTLMLVLLGGEAMLHPHFWAIAEAASLRGFGVNLISNGLLIDDRAADRFRELNFLNVTLSLYSQQAGIHDLMTRRRGSHARTLAALERLRARGISVGLNCLLTGENIDEVFELWEWARSEKLEIRFDPMVTPKLDGTLGSTVTRASTEQILAFYRGMKKRESGYGPVAFGAETDPVCNAGRGKAAVNPYGDLLTCLEVREPLGNLRDHTFQQLWHSPQAEAVRAPRVRDLQFDTACGAGSFCDHCPGVARAETGDGMKPVPFLMEVASVRRQAWEERA